MPPLRERRSDVELLARHFVASLNARFGTSKQLSESALAALGGYAWPGNVRELQHVVEAALVLCDGDAILPEHLPAGVGSNAAAGAPSLRQDPLSLPTLQQLEREHVERVLRASDGHRGNAARILGISERNLYRKLREYGLLS